MNSMFSNGRHETIIGQVRSKAGLAVLVLHVCTVDPCLCAPDQRPHFLPHLSCFSTDRSLSLTASSSALHPRPSMQAGFVVVCSSKPSFCVAPEKRTPQSGPPPAPPPTLTPSSGLRAVCLSFVGVVSIGVFAERFHGSFSGSRFSLIWFSGGSWMETVPVGCGGVVENYP